MDRNFETIAIVAHEAQRAAQKFRETVAPWTELDDEARSEAVQRAMGIAKSEETDAPPVFTHVVRTCLTMYGGHGGFAIENLNALAEFMVNEMGYEPPAEEVSIVASAMGKMIELKLTVDALRHELITRFSQKVQAGGDAVTEQVRRGAEKIHAGDLVTADEEKGE